jgi:hypothetical protein
MDCADQSSRFGGWLFADVKGLESAFSRQNEASETIPQI